MKKKSLLTRLLDVRFFGFFIALLVAAVFLLAANGLVIFKGLDQLILDIHFRLRNSTQERVLQQGAVMQDRSLSISPDIMILGIDNRTLERFGRWPFPRYRHADLLNTLSRIKDQQERERSILLDFFFFEYTDDPVSDVLLRDAINENGRTFLETVLSPAPLTTDNPAELNQRFDEIIARGEVINSINGDKEKLPAWLGIESPILPLSKTNASIGHASFVSDLDGVFRRQPLIIRYRKEVEQISLGTLQESREAIQDRLLADDLDIGFYSATGYPHTLPDPDNNQILEDIIERVQKDGIPIASDSDSVLDNYTVSLFKDYYVPSITLRLAADYLRVPLSDVSIEIGNKIILPEPKMRNIENGSIEPYAIMIKQPEYNETGEIIEPGEFKTVDIIEIPIDEHGYMVINFMGPRSSSDPSGNQTFPVRSFGSYAARATGPFFDTWPESLRLRNKILLAGAFSPGMAEDEKLTPLGGMYGIEVHANALNTIIMDNFIIEMSYSYYLIFILALVIIVALYSRRTSTIISFIITVLLLVILFFVTTFIFDTYSYLIPYAVPALSAFFTFLSIIVYRVMTEEKDKKRIRNMFGKYVSPRVVDQILANPPELGGVDKELTVFFSDIRGFTTLSESMTPQELVNHLNIYLTAMTDIILEFQGTLDKYVGDEIMCFWGAPLPQNEHAILACKCALAQINKLNELNSQWPIEKQIHIGIGINSGIMTVGNMGSLGRMNYTLMGDNVNLGARLEGTNKTYLTEIIISEYTYGLVKDRVVARELDNIRVKGKNKPVVIYELVDVLE
ncbi:adenylate/guanylate cyclase domain-containing protein, partial [Spirochaeta lutea]|uniref:adenylate/guanylate cyclase domain-containing protein n=1 Tax=Spirochaeta lutea TaxID=1480694 RepID=UPI00055CC2BE